MTDLPRNPLHPKMLVLWRLGIGLMALLAIIVSIPLVLVHPAFLAIAVVVVAIALVLPRALYRRWRYEIRERDVFLAHGLVFSSLTVVPFDRIQFVETRQGPLDRALGLAQVVIRTAGGSAAIPGLAPEEAGRLREELARVAGSPSV